MLILMKSIYICATKLTTMTDEQRIQALECKITDLLTYV
jgi:hypothetical protein